MLFHVESFLSSGIKFSQYLEYLPVPSVPLSECNSTQHYNGLLDGDSIMCSGARNARNACKVINRTGFSNSLYVHTVDCTVYLAHNRQKLPKS